MKLSNKTHHGKLRVLAALVTSIALVTCLLVSPQQAPVVLAKISLVTVAAVLAYWIDKILIPQVDSGVLAQQITSDKCTPEEKRLLVDLLKQSMIRRSLITVAVVLGVCLGL